MSGFFEGLEDAKVWLLPGQTIVSKLLDISGFMEEKQMTKDDISASEIETFDKGREFEDRYAIFRIK